MVEILQNIIPIRPINGVNSFMPKRKDKSVNDGENKEKIAFVISLSENQGRTLESVQTKFSGM